MPQPAPSLTLDDARVHLRQSFLGGGSERRVGVEAEWLTMVAEDPTADISIAALREVAHASQPLPGGSKVTFEPGGQIELSSLVHRDVAGACMATLADRVLLERRLLARGISVVGFGMDPVRKRPRVVFSPRYDAMEGYFDHDGPAGRTMMRDTAALQVNLDHGPEDGIAARWHLVHALGPTLAAIFANSPLVDGGPSGWRSSRLATWSSIDGSRTRAATTGPEESPADAWTRYVLAARVMLVRTEPGRYAVERRLPSFASWVTGGHELGFPTLDDLDYHVTTLFPPVRARGWLELRMIDALPDPWWRVAVAITTALVYDDEAAARATRATAGTETLWRDAARHGLGHPALERSAQHCFAAAMEALHRVGTDPSTASAVVAFYERYVVRGRCPADDPLDAWARDPNLPSSQSVMDAWS